MKTIIAVIIKILGEIFKELLPILLGKVREHKEVKPIGQDKDLQEALEADVEKQLWDSLPQFHKWDGPFSKDNEN
jgi:hypothetical protein